MPDSLIYVASLLVAVLTTWVLRNILDSRFEAGLDDGRSKVQQLTSASLAWIIAFLVDALPLQPIVRPLLHRYSVRRGRPSAAHATTEQMIELAIDDLIAFIRSCITRDRAARQQTRSLVLGILIMLFAYSTSAVGAASAGSNHLLVIGGLLISIISMPLSVSSIQSEVNRGAVLASLGAALYLRGFERVDQPDLLLYIGIALSAWGALGRTSWMSPVPLVRQAPAAAITIGALLLSAGEAWWLIRSDGDPLMYRAGLLATSYGLLRFAKFTFQVHVWPQPNMSPELNTARPPQTREDRHESAA